MIASWYDCVVGHASVSLPEVEQEENQVITEKRIFQQEDKIQHSGKEKLNF